MPAIESARGCTAQVRRRVLSTLLAALPWCGAKAGSAITIRRPGDRSARRGATVRDDGALSILPAAMQFGAHNDQGRHPEHALGLEPERRQTREGEQ